MDIYKTKYKTLKDYFNKAAETRIEYRKKKSYYWESITNYCNFFVDETSSVLEIGCGTGELLGKIKGAQKTGIDFSEKMIDDAQTQFPDIQFICMPAEEISLDKKYDVIILSNLVGSALARPGNA